MPAGAIIPVVVEYFSVYFYVFMGWMTEMKQELSRKWLPFKLCRGKQYCSAEHWCV